MLEFISLHLIVYYSNHPGGGGGGGGGNTLTLDNWFSAIGHGDDTAGDEAEDDEDSYYSHPGSNLSSRRNSHHDLGGGHSRSSMGPPNHRGSGHHHEVELNDVDEQEQHELIAPPRSSTRSRSALLLQGGSPFSLELATALKMILFGATNRSFPAGWMGQAFTFNDISSLRFGFVQEKGGPCGVLAAVQASLIQALLFGNRLDDTTRAVNALSPTDKERNRALASALVAILDKCSEKMGKIILVMPSSKAHFSGVGRYRNDGITESLTVHEYPNAREALQFVNDNIGFYESQGNHAVIAFLYSALLTRGFGNVRDDMDSCDLPLMGAHGYCSQEMVNLLLVGKAVSNTFDGKMSLGEDGPNTTVLRGIDEKSEVGLLSLFEHYQSCKVGENLKTPLYPIWLICSESHFTVLFSEHRGHEKTSFADRMPIDLNFYDGLYRQDRLTILTVDCSKSRPPLEEDEDLIPPLEHCIRTKWRDALVDWNGSEKIL